MTAAVVNPPAAAPVGCSAAAGPRGGRCGSGSGSGSSRWPSFSPALAVSLPWNALFTWLVLLGMLTELTSTEVRPSRQQQQPQRDSLHHRQRHSAANYSLPLLPLEWSARQQTSDFHSHKRTLLRGEGHHASAPAPSDNSVAASDSDGSSGIKNLSAKPTSSLTAKTKMTAASSSSSSSRQSLDSHDAQQPHKRSARNSAQLHHHFSGDDDNFFSQHFETEEMTDHHPLSTSGMFFESITHAATKCQVFLIAFGLSKV